MEGKGRKKEEGGSKGEKAAPKDRGARGRQALM